MYPNPKTSPWGKVTEANELASGVYAVETRDKAGIMVWLEAAQVFLSSAARQFGCYSNGYHCFHGAEELAVIEYELLEHGIYPTGRNESEMRDFKDKLTRLVQEVNPAYWQKRQESNASLNILIDRINKNYDDFMADIMGQDKNSIINAVHEISAVSDAHYYLTESHDFSVSEAEYLLNFQNPLEIVADEWARRRDDISDMSFAIDSILERPDSARDTYALMSDPGHRKEASAPLSPADRIKAEARRITKEFLTLTEPNSPNKTHFMVKLSPEFMLHADSKDTSRLLAAIPVKNMSLSNTKGEKGIFAFAPKGKHGKLELKRSKASVLADLAEKTQEVKARPAPEAKPSDKKDPDIS